MILDSRSDQFKITWSQTFYAVGCRCYLCGDGIPEFSMATRDHVTPRSKGGSKLGLNLLPTHPRCNHHRGNQDLTQEQKLRSIYYRVAVIAYALTEEK